MVGKNSCVVVYDDPLQAERAVGHLLHQGFDARHLSLIGRERTEEGQAIGLYSTGERMRLWGARGAFWGGLWGMLMGAALVWVPGLGAVVMAGPLVGLLGGALKGAAVAGGLGALGAALYGIGIPGDSIDRYRHAIAADRFLLIAHGEQREVERIHDVLAAGEARDITLHLG